MIKTREKYGKEEKVGSPIPFLYENMQKAWDPPNIVSLPSLFLYQTRPQLLYPFFLSFLFLLYQTQCKNFKPSSWAYLGNIVSKIMLLKVVHECKYEIRLLLPRFKISDMVDCFTHLNAYL